MSKIPIALQLFSVRDDAQKDLAGVLKQVKAMGYDGVEFAGFYGHSASDVRKMLDDNDLPVCGAHIGIDTLIGESFPATVEYHQTIGNKYLIVPGLPSQYTSTNNAWRETALVMNEIAANLRPHGMQTGYHNHHTEFTALEGDGLLPWDIFFGNTDSDVIMQFDTGNALHGGASSLPSLQKYPGRAVTVHLKEHSANSTALIGEGDVPFADIFQICETTGGTKWYIVEQETYAHPPLECSRLCLENLRKMGK